MRLISLGALLLAAVPTLSAGIIFTREAAGIQQTTVAGATTENFNSLAPGLLGSYVSPVGTYSAGAAIVNPDAFGGANQTKYISVGVQSGTSQYTLTLNGPQAYLGLYWAAGDVGNHLDFYAGVTLVGTFAVNDLTPTLSSAYFGNPNTGQNAIEPYAYLDFTSTDLASRFDRVVFRETTGGGFETDNHSVFDQLISPPGVPETSTWTLTALGFAAIVVLRRRRRLARLV